MEIIQAQQKRISPLSPWLQGTRLKRAVVIHTTAYDGTLERAAFKLGVPCLSLTDSQVNHTYAVTTTANMMLQDIAIETT